MNNTNLPVRVLEVEVESMHDPTCYKTREDPEGRFPKMKIGDIIYMLCQKRK